MFGLDQFDEPPDTQLAAGPGHLVETLNDTITVWSKTGVLLDEGDLNTFFPVPVGYRISDPRVLYDAPSGRWLVSSMSFDSASGGQVYVAMSATSDPTGVWAIYTIASNTSGLLYDQPKLGVSDDKIVVSWNTFVGASFTGSQTAVIEKSDLLVPTTARTVVTALDVTRFSPVPAQALTSTPVAYVVYHNPATASVGVITISGTPALSDVTASEVDPGITPTAQPPSADQPGLPASVDTGDDRFTNAVWQNGTLWTGGDDACIPSGDAVVRPCVRLVDVSTAGTPTVTQSFDVGTRGAGDFYGAPGIDALGNLHVVYSSSSSASYVGVVVGGQQAGMPRRIRLRCLHRERAGPVRRPLLLRHARSVTVG